jgi:preprotein translocase subunit SecD
MDQSITYVGLDVHKDTIAVALAQAGRRNEVREYGKIANTPTAFSMPNDANANADSTIQRIVESASQAPSQAPACPA